MLYTIPMLTKQGVQLWLLQRYRVEGINVMGTKSLCQNRLQAINDLFTPITYRFALFFLINAHW